MTYTTLQVMKKMAAERLKFGDLEFAGFEKIDTTMISERVEGADDADLQVEVWANFRVKYEGELPESYRTINAMVMDWVDGHEDDIKKRIGGELVPWMRDQYPGTDLSELEEDVGDFLWEDQVDYMPEVYEDKHVITFTVELVMDVEMEEDDE